MLRVLVGYASKQESQDESWGLPFVQLFMGVSHDSGWQSMLLSIHNPARFFSCPDVSTKECSGSVQCTFTAGSETYMRTSVPTCPHVSLCSASSWMAP